MEMVQAVMRVAGRVSVFLVVTIAWGLLSWIEIRYSRGLRLTWQRRGRSKDIDDLGKPEWQRRDHLVVTLAGIGFWLAMLAFCYMFSDMIDLE